MWIFLGVTNKNQGSFRKWWIGDGGVASLNYCVNQRPHNLLTYQFGMLAMIVFAEKCWNCLRQSWCAIVSWQTKLCQRLAGNGWRLGMFGMENQECEIERLKKRQPKFSWLIFKLQFLRSFPLFEPLKCGYHNPIPCTVEPMPLGTEANDWRLFHPLHSRVTNHVTAQAGAKSARVSGEFAEHVWFFHGGYRL